MTMRLVLVSIRFRPQHCVLFPVRSAPGGLRTERRRGEHEQPSGTLAAKYSLQEQLVQNENLDEIPAEIDYSRGYVALEEEREKSKKYLDRVFEEAERAGLCK